MKLLKNELIIDDIKTYEQYETIFKVRHDAIHWLICEHRDITFGERTIYSILHDEKLKEHPHYKLIEKQTPDMIVVSGNHVKISELTISRFKFADSTKISKYSLLVDVIKSAGYDVSMEVIVINAMYSIPDYNFLLEEHKFSIALIDQIYVIIDAVEKTTHRLTESNRGREFQAIYRGVLKELKPIPISKDDVTGFYDLNDAKAFNNTKDLMDVLNSTETNVINEKDEAFIDFLVDQAIHLTPKLAKSQDSKIAVDTLLKHHEKFQKKTFDHDLRAFMPLPFFKKRVIDSAIRSTANDDDLTVKVSALMGLSDDPTINVFKSMTKSIDKVKVSNSLKKLIALDGPGRAYYSRKGSIEHITAQNKHKGIWYPVGGDYCGDIEDLSWKFSDCVAHNSIYSGYGLDYIKLCQSIYREININALRKERRDHFILKPTGAIGLYVLLHKGAKLRTGENLSIIWFRLIILKEYFEIDEMSLSWMFKKIHNDKEIYYSNWLSTDANRLDHYIRCYDKIILSYACYCSASGRDMSECMQHSGSNTLGMISLIYMENKRSTSKMLQDVRYLVMSMVSMFIYYEDIFKKFIDPIRTPLQSYLLKLIVDYVQNPDVRTCVLSSNFGRLNVDSSTGEVFDRMAGANIIMPRILTKGPPINFKQILSEMYFTMLFNKNQDDPTHASFQILGKILEGEESLREVKQTTKLHTGFVKGDIEDAKTLINNPHKNQFSRRAIIIASKLQASSEMNKANNGLAHSMAAQHRLINKSLDEFATFKSSSTMQRSHFDPKVYKSSKDKDEHLEEDIKQHITGDRGVQNRRRRCIEGIQDLIVNHKCLRSFDLIPLFIWNPIVFQIFKKNQIGGVREILILDIQSRILINILESISRVICHEDEREMLTHGDKKVSLMRDFIRSLKRGSGKKMIMNYNFDKTRWAPSFMPIQFLYMFLPFKHLYPTIFNYIMMILINHTNKEFMLPEKLIRAWINDFDNKYKHFMDPNLQRLKEAFLKERKLTYLNESNMGQGILHYTSSYYHLCFISLRDEVFKRLCKKLRIDPGSWKDLVSSDDSYTAHAIPLDNKRSAQARILLFLRAQEVCERVMNIWTSTSKSSISLLIYEFNSLFGSNLTMYPTTLKFALAAVHPVNTDSFFRMVKESYIACRQIVENGGSLELYELASNLNKIYCESIYHTYPGGANDPRQFGLHPDKVPFQLGIYPIRDPALMIIFGPEVQNYEILHNLDLNQLYLNESEKNMFLNMHSLVDVDDPSIFAAINSIDDIFVGVYRIEAHLGPIKRLEYIRRQIPVDQEWIMGKIIANPLILFKEPENIEELQVKVFIKLFQKGAAEALRTTAASIYYGRVAASVSANAYTIPLLSFERTTYSNCMRFLLDLKPKPMEMKYLYPHLAEFDLLYRLSLAINIYDKRDVMETQNIRQLQLNKLQQRITNPIINVLSHYWVTPEEDSRSSLERDWINLRESVPVISNSLEETLIHFNGDRKQQVRSLLLIILRLLGYSSKPMKAIIYGPSSRAYDNSYLILKQQNASESSTCVDRQSNYMVQNVVKITDKLNFAYNCFALSIISGHIYNNKTFYKPLLLHHLIDNHEIESFMLDNTTGTGAFKKIMMMLLYHGLMTSIKFWSDRTKTIFHKWVERGSKVNNRYIGSYVLKLQLSNVILIVKYDGFRQIKLVTNVLNNLFYLNELMEAAIEHSTLTKDVFLSYCGKGDYLLGTNKILLTIRENGFKIILDSSIQDLSFRPTHIKYEGGFFIIYEDEDVIFKTIEGLLHSNYIPSREEMKFDINLHGVLLSKLVPCRPFDSNFSVDYMSERDCMGLLRDESNSDSRLDLVVPRPRVSKITNQRLNLRFPEREIDLEFSEFMGPEEPAEEPNLAEVNPYDYVLDFIENPEIDRILNESKDKFTSNIHDIWTDPDLDINLLRTLTRQKITYQPKRVLERVLNIKYQIITKLCTNVNLLNSRTIRAIKMNTQNNFVWYSLIYAYDRQFTNTETPSPTGCKIQINSTFDERYIVPFVKYEEDDDLDPDKADNKHVTSSSSSSTHSNIPHLPK
jgi:hypothetical protein